MIERQFKVITIFARVLWGLSPLDNKSVIKGGPPTPAAPWTIPPTRPVPNITKRLIFRFTFHPDAIRPTSNNTMVEMVIFIALVLTDTRTYVPTGTVRTRPKTITETLFESKSRKAKGRRYATFGNSISIKITTASTGVRIIVSMGMISRADPKPKKPRKKPPAIMLVIPKNNSHSSSPKKSAEAINLF